MFGNHHFSSLQKIAVNAQLGPFQTFEELQSAVAREMPGAVVLPANPKQGQNGGEIKNSSGAVIGGWSMPFNTIRPLTLNVYCGPYETYEELQSAVALQLPGSTLVAAGPHAKDAHSGDVRDSQGHIDGTWTEAR